MHSSLSGGPGLTGSLATAGAVLALPFAWALSFVAAAEDYLKHDIYVQKIVGRFNALLVRTYGRNYARWRDVFSDRALLPPARRDRPSTRRI